MTPETKNAHRRTPDIKEIRANSFKLPVKDPLAAVADLSEDQTERDKQSSLQQNKPGLNSFATQDKPKKVTRFVIEEEEEHKTKRHTQNSIVISMNCSKAMTITNYNELVSMVSKQKKATHS